MAVTVNVMLLFSFTTGVELDGEYSTIFSWRVVRIPAALAAG